MRSLIVVLSSIILVMVCGCASPRPLSQGERTDCGNVGPPVDKLVTVTVHPDGTWSLSGDVQEGIVYFDSPGQTVTWQHATAGAFLDIDPVNRGAFDKTSFGNDKKRLKVRNSKGKCAAYKYEINLEGRTIDPVIIVRY